VGWAVDEQVCGRGSRARENGLQARVAVLRENGRAAHAAPARPPPPTGPCRPPPLSGGKAHPCTLGQAALPPTTPHREHRVLAQAMPHLDHHAFDGQRALLVPHLAGVVVEAIGAQREETLLPAVHLKGTHRRADKARQDKTDG
jgi:hypothetical protein